jgi:hypothetical protein
LLIGSRLSASVWASLLLAAAVVLGEVLLQSRALGGAGVLNVAVLAVTALGTMRRLLQAGQPPLLVARAQHMAGVTVGALMVVMRRGERLAVVVKPVVVDVVAAEPNLETRR